MRAKIRAVVLVILAAGAMIAQQPIQVQGRDYAKGVPHILNTDANGKLNVNASISGAGGCVGTTVTPCVVSGIAADGATISGAPVPVAGKGIDGFAHYLSVDNSGRQVIVGPAATGAAVAGNPVRIAGKDQVGVTRDLALTDGGLLPINSFALAGADGVSNTVNSFANQANSQQYNRVLPYLFNGATNDRQFSCTNSAPIAVSSSGNTQIVALTAATTIRICHISWSVSDGSADAVKLTTGTGSDCGTGTADVSGVYTSPGVALDFGAPAALRGAASSALCLNLGTGVAVGGVVVYAKF